jgi:hypothetical protein
MSKASYDDLLSSIPFYQSHGCMTPFVGENYESSKHKKLLLIGESHYMPEGSIVHHDADLWYNGPLTLSEEEQRWCDTCGSRGCNTSVFTNRVNSSLHELINSDNNAWQEVASINYFLRPCDYKQNVNGLWRSYGGKNVDCEQAICNFIKTLEVLKPDLFVFLSCKVCKLAERDYPKFFGGKLWGWTSLHNINYTYTNHPSSHWWYKPMKKYPRACGKTSREYFYSWLEENWLR